MFSIQKQLLFFLLLSVLNFSCNRIHQPEIIREINSGWKFKKQSDSSWLKAKVPGTVHTDLLENQLIEKLETTVQKKKVIKIVKRGQETQAKFRSKLGGIRMLKSYVLFLIPNITIT